MIEILLATLRHELTAELEVVVARIVARSHERKLLSTETKKCPMNSQQLAFVLVIDEA
jgi:hypothetical protein